MMNRAASTRPALSPRLLFTVPGNGSVYAAVNCRGTSHGLTRNTVKSRTAITGYRPAAFQLGHVLTLRAHRGSRIDHEIHEHPSLSLLCPLHWPRTPSFRSRAAALVRWALFDVLTRFARRVRQLWPDNRGEISPVKRADYLRRVLTGPERGARVFSGHLRNSVSPEAATVCVPKIARASRRRGITRRGRIGFA